MSLRGKLVGLFGALAVVPLLAVGLFDYLRSIRALESLVIAQTSVIAERAADELADRFRVLEANAGLLGENAETAALYRLHSRGDTARSQKRDSIDRYLADVWQVVGRDIASISYRDPDGREIYRLGEDTRGQDLGSGRLGRTYVLQRPIEDGVGRRLGTLYVAARLDSMLPRAALDARFGRSGFAVVVDRHGDSVIYASSGAEAATRLPVPSWLLEPSGAADTAGSSIVVPDRDSSRVVSRAIAPATPFSVLSVAKIDEFAAPFARIRTSNLAIVLALTLVVAIGFIFFLWRGTASLAALTTAADRVAGGNLQPALPAPGRDEVGRLSAAFAYMLERIRATLREVERSRQLAAVGEFASQIAHEIRNPLTGIKLNLQKLERAAAQRRVPEDLARPIEISLAEIQRLDGVVRGVLRLGRPQSATRIGFCAQEVVSRALEATRPQIEPSGLTIIAELAAERDRIFGDPALLQSGIVNLLLNGAEAMPNGGTLYVRVENNGDGRSAVVQIRIEDDGPGVPIEARDRVFDPFFTTKPGGTGLGLALAHRTVEEHRGRLTLEAPVRGSGAAFVMEFPLADGAPT